MSKPSLVEITCFLRPQIRDLEGFVGAILLGSVSAGMQDWTSDYDIQLVFEDEALERHPEYRNLLIDGHGRKVDCRISSLSELAATDPASDRAKEYVHAQYMYDRTGRVKTAVSTFVCIAPENQHERIALLLDLYYKALYRAFKCNRRGNKLGFHTLATESILRYIDVLYAVNGTTAPRIDRVPVLLGRLPLLPAPAEVLIGMFETICTTASVRTQLALFDLTCLWMDKNGYRYVQEAWEGSLEAEIDKAR